MGKKFKAKRRKKIGIGRILILFLMVYVVFSVTYRTIYKIYITEVDDDKIIKKIITHNKIKQSKFSIDNMTSPEFLLKYTLDIDLYNKIKELNVVKEVDKKSLVYIYNTHETETYSFEGANVYNILPTVKTADYILQENLLDLGISSIIEENSVTDILRKNGWKYSRSYDASKTLIEDKLREYKDIELIIDLHRDSSPKNRTLLEVNEKKYAKVLFVVGLEHDNYKANLELAETLSLMIEELVPGLSRGISEKSGDGVNGIYNQNLSSKAVLIEVGGQYNELEEVNNTMPIIARAIFNYLEEKG